MLSLPHDVLGVILKKKNPARRFAHTCKRALEITKSLFSIEVDDCQIVVTRMYGKVWVAPLCTGCYIAPWNSSGSYVDRSMISVDGDPTLEIAAHYKELGAAVLYCRDQSGVFVYELAAAVKLEYFGQFLKLMGPLCGVFIGNTVPPGLPRTLRVCGNIHLVLSAPV